VRHHACSLHLVQSLCFNQSQYRVKCAPHLERTDPLKVLALEEQPHRGRSRLLSLPWRALERVGGLGRRCQAGQGGVGQHGRGVDVGFDERVGFLDGSTRQGAGVKRGGQGGHGG